MNTSKVKLTDINKSSQFKQGHIYIRESSNDSKLLRLCVSHPDDGLRLVNLNTGNSIGVDINDLYYNYIDVTDQVELVNKQ